MQLLVRIVTVSLCVQHTLADWQFRSRPDLAPPRLNITIPATTDVEKGYLFLAPFAGLPDTPTEKHGPRQAGPYIFRDDGDLIWSGYGIYSIWSTNFQAGRWNGKDIIFSFEGDHNAGYGDTVILRSWTSITRPSGSFVLVTISWLTSTSSTLSTRRLA
jgi:hypothetical protein